MTNTEVYFNVESKQMAVLSQQKLLQCIIQSLSHISVSYAVEIFCGSQIWVHQGFFLFWHKLMLLFMNMQYSIIPSIFIVEICTPRKKPNTNMSSQT
jgi:hypothetical protein